MNCNIWVWKNLDFFRYRHRGPTNLSCRRSKKRRTHCRILQHGEMRTQEKTANWKLRTEDADPQTQPENLNALSTIVTIFPVNSAGADLISPEISTDVTAKAHLRIGSPFALTNVSRRKNNGELICKRA